MEVCGYTGKHCNVYPFVSGTGVVVGRVPDAKSLASVPEFAGGSDESLSSVTPPAQSMGAVGSVLSDSLLSLIAPDTSRAAQERVFIGEGLPTVPKRLFNRMVAWEFVDLAELRPLGALEAIHQESEQQKLLVMPAYGFQVSKARKKPIKELNTWVQCFLVYMAAVASKHPSALSEMVAYMLTIMKAAQEFEDPAWILYDVAYRDKAAATGNQRWSQIDTGLYNQVFTGRARQLKTCLHPLEECAEGSRKRPREEHIGGPRPAKGARSDVCFLFNKGRCTFEVCKFRHMCSICGGRHAAVSCLRKAEKGTQGAGWGGPSPRP